MLPAVVQAVHPYYSPDDTIKGTRWAAEIAAVLEESKVGLICVTPENIHAPWILFEAGALSKQLHTSRVIPILFGLEPDQLTGPLVQFQAAKFDKHEMKRVVRTVNTEVGDMKLAADVLEQVFEVWWPKLEERVSHALTTKPKRTTPRSHEDILKEVLSLVRALAREPIVRLARPSGFDPESVRDLVAFYAELVDGAETINTSSPIIVTLQSLIRPIAHIVNTTAGLSDEEATELASRLDQSEDALSWIIGGGEEPQA